MEAKNKVKRYFKEYSGNRADEIISLAGSGSDRNYFRVRSGDESVIAVINNNREENDAFVRLGELFLRKGLPVPEVFSYYPEENIYFQTDLGDTSLYSWLKSIHNSDNNANNISNIYKKVVESLVDFQTRTYGDIDLDICYPHRSFDRQSMMWDMNYFKYMFLKLVSVFFNEHKLEKDFHTLADKLLEAGQEYFLYRDFQSANIMLVDSSPWFIDFQGGRGGAPQYDLASLLYDSKARLSPELRQELLSYYLNIFCSASNYSQSRFLDYFPAFVLVRILQAMGAYGFRGIFEKKDGFAQSISPAVEDLHNILSLSGMDKEVPELWQVAKRLLQKQAVFEKMK